MAVVIQKYFLPIMIKTHENLIESFQTAKAEFLNLWAKQGFVMEIEYRCSLKTVPGDMGFIRK